MTLLPIQPLFDAQPNIHSLQVLQQIFSTKNYVRIQFDGDKKVDIAKGLHLSPQELHWIAQEINHWWSHD